jgi:hypothetical protein
MRLLRGIGSALCAFVVVGCDLLLGIDETNATQAKESASESEPWLPVSAWTDLLGRRADTGDAATATDAAGNGATDAGDLDGGMDSGLAKDAAPPPDEDSGDEMPWDVVLDCRPSNEEDGGVSSAAHELTAPSGVALWLDAAYGVTTDEAGRVQSWRDRSRYDHEAQPIGVAANWPVLVASAHGEHPALRFGSVEETGGVRRIQVADHASLQFGLDDFALIAVLRHRNPTPVETAPNQIGAIYQKQCATCMGFSGVALFANDDWGLYAGDGPTRSTFAFQVIAYYDRVARSAFDGFNDFRLHLVVARRLGNVLEIEVDKAPHASGFLPEPVDVSSPGVPVSIGAHAGGGQQILEGDLFELVAVRGDSARDLDGIVDCLAGKYGLR